ncbi:hypothetical protein ZWY2020_036150 [Hordeum vulgare]|nr:hypothetical protein ZWY2020_036150 [Hordeum vulgare]
MLRCHIPPQCGPAPLGRRGLAAATALRCAARGPSRGALVAAGAAVAAAVATAEGVERPGLAERLRMGSLLEDGLSYKESFIVRCYEVGINKTATVETIANLLQEVGCNHAQSVGFSTDGFATTTTMRELGLIWDLANGEVIGRATSKWVMMNQNTRRLQRVSDEVRDEVFIHCPKSPRLAFPEENNGSLKKIPVLTDPAQHSRLGLVPRRADLDMNQHVNNVTYIGWVLESIPQDIIDTHELQTITLDYRRECQHDDIVDSLTYIEEGEEINSNGSLYSVPHPEEQRQFLHCLRFAGAGDEINRGRTVWRKLAR